MGWREQLRPASFRGAPFGVDGTDAGGGRRVAVHEYPNRDEPYAEDMGRKAREFSVDGFVLGANYMAARDALIAALEQSGAGILVHPYRGTLRVQATDYRVRESSGEGGIARFSISFIEAGALESPTVAVDTAAAVDAAADGALDAAKNHFSGKFSVAGQPGWVTSAASANVAAALNTVKDLGDRLPVIPAEAYDFQRGLSLLTQEVADIIHYPSNLAGSITSYIGDLGRILQRPADALKLYDSLGDFGSGFKPVPTTTPTNRAQAANQAGVVDLTRQAGAIGLARTTAAVDYASSNDALAARDAAVDALDAVAETADDTTYQALISLRAAVVADIAARGAQLPRVANVQVSVTMPALVAAYRLYGDASGADELVARNGLKHPGFVPGGVSVEILVDA